ncbi:HNH endonuclease [Pseudomonas sp. SC11]|uniref:HNH endonuclease n=1 Tax=Pseudomonas sp. SC11 TaxID=326927 RepID=UPI00399A0023
MHKFFYGLYDFDAAPLKQKVGNIDEHYKSFVQVNSQGKCPFCGINDLFIEYHTKREAYDHYLPKAIYPFNSINLKNLAPSCHHCNSSYKSTKNPAYSPKDPAGVMSRRKAFYPFSTIPYSIGLEVKLLHADIKNLVPSDIDLSFSPPMLTEEISTWKDVYGIEERYRAKFLSPSAKAWLEEVLTEQRWHSETAGVKGRTPEAYLEAVTCHASNFPYANENFLKHGFLQACKAVGMFDEPVKVNGT